MAFDYTQAPCLVTRYSAWPTNLQNEGNKEQEKYKSVLLSVPLASNTHYRRKISLRQVA